MNRGVCVSFFVHERGCGRVHERDCVCLRVPACVLVRACRAVCSVRLLKSIPMAATRLRFVLGTTLTPASALYEFEPMADYVCA